MGQSPLSYAKAVLGLSPDQYRGLVDTYPACLADEHLDLLREGISQLAAHRSGSVYVCAHPAWPGMLKIGCTKGQVVARVASLKTAGVLGSHILLHWWWHLDAYRLETLAHRALRSYRTEGTEWFNVSLSVARQAIEKERQQDLQKIRALLRHPEPS